METKSKKGMTLQEFTTRLQTLCHDGYAQNEVLIDLNGFGVHLAQIEEVHFCIKSSATKEGYISVTMGDWHNEDCW